MISPHVHRHELLCRSLTALVEGTTSPGQVLTDLLLASSSGPHGIEPAETFREVTAALGAALIDLGQLDEPWTPGDLVETAGERPDLAAHLTDAPLERLVELAVLTAAGHVRATDELLEPLASLPPEDRINRTIGLLAAALSLLATASYIGSQAPTSTPKWSLTQVPDQALRTFGRLCAVDDALLSGEYLAAPNGGDRWDQSWRFHHHGETYLFRASARQADGILTSWFDLFVADAETGEWGLEAVLAPLDDPETRLN